MSEIVTYLRGKRLLITGATGFLAKALVEKILRCAPDVGRLYLVVRSRRRKDGTTLSAKERVEEEILQSAAFARLREIHGDRYAEFMGEKVHAVEGDLTLDHLGLEPELYQRLAAEVHVVLTCAASVTFDEEIDAALQLNALGAKRMLEFAHACADAMLVHVSTAYVNGQRKGRIPEVPPRPDWSMAPGNGAKRSVFRPGAGNEGHPRQGRRDPRGISFDRPAGTVSQDGASTQRAPHAAVARCPDGNLP